MCKKRDYEKKTTSLPPISPNLTDSFYQNKDFTVAETVGLISFKCLLPPQKARISHLLS